jgi:hypothetical protein
MKKIYFIFILLLLISCGYRPGMDLVEETTDGIALLPGTQLIVAGDSLNSDFILQVAPDGSIIILENKSETVIENPEEKYREILTEIKKEFASNKKITKCKKEQSMWIGKIGVNLTVEGAITGKKGKILACYHKGNKTLIEPNYQVRTDLPLVEVRIGEKHYEIVSFMAFDKYIKRTLQ